MREEYYSDLEIPSTWKNVSHGNDACPSFSINGYQVFIDHPDKTQREEADWYRFRVQHECEYGYHSIWGLDTDSFSKVCVAVSASYWWKDFCDDIKKDYTHKMDLSDIPMGEFFTRDPLQDKRLGGKGLTDFRLIDNSSLFILVDQETYPTITYVVGRFENNDIVYEDNVQTIVDAFQLALKLDAKYPEKKEGSVETDFIFEVGGDMDDTYTLRTNKDISIQVLDKSTYGRSHTVYHVNKWIEKEEASELLYKTLVFDLAVDFAQSTAIQARTINKKGA